MQILTIEGRLGRDAKLKESTSGQRFITFTVAVNSKIRGAEKTTWYEVISFNEMYFDWTRYLTKGSSVAVTGDLDVGVQEGTDGVTRLRASINAFKLDFPVSSSGETNASVTKSAAPQAKATEEEIPEDIPMTTKPKKVTKQQVVEAEVEEDDTDENLPF